MLGVNDMTDSIAQNKTHEVFYSFELHDVKMLV